MCTDGNGHHASELRTPSTVRRGQAIHAAARSREAATGKRYQLTAEERAALPDPTFSEPHDLLRQPIPLVAVAQLYRRDVPDWAGPDGTDVLQVLWCPLDHPNVGYTPRVNLYWRSSADVGRPLDTPLEPAVVNDSYLPVACVLHPEQVREYQYGGLLPEELDDRIAAWEEQIEQGTSGAPSPPGYDRDLSLAPGWKVGGFANWSLTDPVPMACEDCGTAMTLLLTVDSSEWQGADSSWRPKEDPVGAWPMPTGVTIGRGDALYVFRCPQSFRHPWATVVQ